MFFKKEINPYTVTDKVTFRNVDKTLVLYVRSDAASLVTGLKKAQEQLKGITDSSSEKERLQAAFTFAAAIFGEDQANQLIEFYGEPLAVITVVNMYFDRMLKYKITKAQKK